MTTLEMVLSTPTPANNNLADTCDIRDVAYPQSGTEDPYLMGQLGTAWTEGLQKGDGTETRFIQVAATLKHFDANSLEDSDGYAKLHAPQS